jgi:hypothetical protein
LQIFSLLILKRRLATDGPEEGADGEEDWFENQAEKTQRLFLDQIPRISVLGGFRNGLSLFLYKFFIAKAAFFWTFECLNGAA